MEIVLTPLLPRLVTEVAAHRLERLLHLDTIREPIEQRTCTAAGLRLHLPKKLNRFVYGNPRLLERRALHAQCVAYPGCRTFEQIGNVLERHANRPQGENMSHALTIGIGVETMPGLRARRPQQTEAVVMLQRSNGHASQGGEFTYSISHEPSFNPDAASGSTPVTSS